MIFIAAKIDNARKILMEATRGRVVRNVLKLCSPAYYMEQAPEKRNTATELFSCYNLNQQMRIIVSDLQ
jgi:hypothetical protein